MSHKIDVEAELAQILDEEVWKEITAETGKTKQDFDNEIIAKLKELNCCSGGNSAEVEVEGALDRGSIPLASTKSTLESGVGLPSKANDPRGEQRKTQLESSECTSDGGDQVSTAH